MTEHARRPPGDAATEIYDPERPRAHLVVPAAPGPSASSSAPAASAGRRPASSTLPAPAGPPPPALQGRPGPLTPLFESLEQDPTELTPMPRPGLAIELATPTQIDPSPPTAPEATPARPRGLERSEPIRVISMKDQTNARKPRAEDPRIQLQVQLRSMAEVAGRKDTPVTLGRLAPPRDPRQARARHVRANVVWAGVAVVLACVISLAIWLLAGK